MNRNKLVMSIQGILGFSLICFMILYCYFWENIYIRSGMCFLFIGIIAGVYLLLKGNIAFDMTSKLLLLIVSYNVVSLVYTKASFEAGIKWCASLFVIFLFIVCVKNIELKNIYFKRAFIVIGLLFVGGVYAQVLGLPIVNSINTAMLKPDSLLMNSTAYSWGYYCGFSGYNMVPALYAMITMCILLGEYFETTNKSKKFLFLFGVLVCYVSIILTQKRGVFVAATLALLVLYWLERLHKKTIKKQVTFFTSIVLVFVIIYIFLVNSEAGALFLSRFNSSDDISSGRFEIYSTLLNNWWEYFVFGNGAVSTKNYFSINAHNIYIQVFFENGIIGLGLYLLWFIGNLVYVFRNYRSNNASIDGKKSIALTSIAIQIGFLTYGLFGNPLNDLFVFLFYGFFSSLPYAGKKKCNN